MQTLFCWSCKFIRVIVAVCVVVFDVVVVVVVVLLIKHTSGPRVIRVSSCDTKFTSLLFALSKFYD